MKNCVKCGANLDDAAMFCNVCGANQQKQVTETAADVQTEVAAPVATEVSVAPVAPAAEAVQAPEANVEAAQSVPTEAVQPQAVAAPQANVCAYCGTPVGSEIAFCPKCGQKINVTPDSLTTPAATSAINQFNEQVTQTKTKKKTLPLILGIVAVVLVVIIAATSSAAKKAAIEEYRETASLFYDLALESGTDLEDVGNDVQSYWSNYIYTSGKYVYYKGHYMSSIDDAVAYALSDNSDLVNTIKSDYEKLKTYYNTLSDVPDDELDSVYREVKNVYDAYVEMYECVINVSGNYTTYKTEFGNCDTALANAVGDLRDVL